MNVPSPGAQALKYWETRQAVLANNLANVTTPGFKGERLFARLLDEETLVAGGETDFSPGPLSATGQPLDLALAGPGFFVVETEAGPRWTRAGSFSLDPAGVLVDGAGRPVLGDAGPIVLPPGEVRVEADGSILTDGVLVARLRLERPGDTGVPERSGGNLWRPTGDAERVSPGDADVRQGHLEESNVHPTSALVEMIEIQRAYAAVQRSMETADGIMETITTELGRLG